MLKLNRDGANLERLSIRTLAQAKILERRDLQRMIAASPEPFFQEMGETIVLIGQEIQPSDYVNDSIDLLAIDGDGAAVIIELKRADHKLQLLQAMSYAAMLSDWSADDFVDARSTFASETHQDASDAIRDHVALTNPSEINRSQRVILIAEGFDFALLKTAEWLSETYGVDIKCFRLEYASDGLSEYVSCICVFPPVPLVDQALRVKKGKALPRTRSNANWEELVAGVNNSEIRQFFEGDISGGEKRPNSRDVAVRIKGDRRFHIGVRKNHAYVWQTGRFDGDEEFWKERLSEPTTVQPVDNGRSLRFNLRTAADTEAFKGALDTKIPAVEFVDADENPFIDETVDEGPAAER